MVIMTVGTIQMNRIVEVNSIQCMIIEYLNIQKHSSMIFLLYFS